MSDNPFKADSGVRSRMKFLEASIGPAVRAEVAERLRRTRSDVAANSGGMLPRADAEAISRRHQLALDELMLLSLGEAENFARPPISNFFVGAVGLEAETGNLIFGGNLEFAGAHIGNTVHGEGFVFARAFSRGTSVSRIALGEAHPCAHCRQFLSEFASASGLKLIDPLGHSLILAQLYPWPFDPGYLGQSGIVAGQIRQPDLRTGGDGLEPAVAERLGELGRRAYSPYSGNPAAIVLALADGSIVGGSVIESVAFNPTMSPLQAAMIDLFAHGYETSDIIRAVIATDPGAQVDYVETSRAFLGAVRPGLELEVTNWVQGRG